MQEVISSAGSRQEGRVQTPPLDAVADLRRVREKSFRNERRHSAGVHSGQFLLLALAYRRGERPSPRMLSRFFSFISKDQAINAASRGAA
jgi:hypothetical protein